MDYREALISDISFDGDVLKIKGQRAVTLPTAWLATLQKEMQDILGTNGAYAVINKANTAGADVMVQHILKQTEGLSLEERISVIFPRATISGWGSLELLSVEKEPLKVVIKYINSYLSGIITGAEESQCFFMSGLVALIEGIVKNEKPDANFELNETTCVSKGDPFCTFEIVESEF